MMKKVYICSPLGGDIKGNLEKVNSLEERLEKYEKRRNSGLGAVISNKPQRRSI